MRLLGEEVTGGGSGGGVFGSGYTSGERTTQLATSAPAYVQYTSITTGSLDAGTYRVDWSFIARSSSTFGDWNVRVQVDNTIEIIAPGQGDRTQEEGKDGGADQRVARSGYRDIVLGAGVHTVDMDVAQVGFFGTSFYYFGNLAIYRVS